MNLKAGCVDLQLCGSTGVNGAAFSPFPEESYGEFSPFPGM